ncbi:MAG: peptidoglycan DD-metalloendopeptidase family protein [Gammaproteobacteria bacterium]|nr:peptidoglycan DD-metalloendopeptidase family protein [Gammaproteobacteria bacterium]MBU1655059.1 peptidoglycan DD-metalloendopeptidase family protein [Gammaproteobacteria bacterium]MBU1961758.1 peptidoglycan DD-metalloendopeptidase family protein [Gammaproteobacteria bacterium]
MQLQEKRRAGFVATVPLVLWLTGCFAPDMPAPVFESGREVSNRAPVAQSPAAPPISGRYYVVQPGDTLYSIAWRENQDYRALASWNGLPASYTIHPGQRLRLTTPSGPALGQGGTPSSRAGQGAARHAGRADTIPPGGADRIQTNLHWRWPTQGRVVSGYAEGDIGRKGMLIAGREGQPVYAAEQGRVVYSGIGLKGYGRLIIVKHDKDYLSAYGHNRRILVKEGDAVAVGQQIAEMGQAGRDQSQLHFEIRYQGKPVNPARLLPPM